jgi:hypothetical protein
MHRLPTLVLSFANDFHFVWKRMTGNFILYKRLRLTARVDCGMSPCSARRSLGAPR